MDSLHPPCGHVTVRWRPLGAIELARAKRPVSRKKSMNSICRAHVARMPHFTNVAMPLDEKAHPMQVGLLSVEAIVKVTNTLPHLVKHARGLQERVAVFHRNFINGCLSSSLLANQGCKWLSGGSDVQNIEDGPVYRAGFALYITLAVQDMRAIIFIFFCFISSSALAGGDYVLGKIVNFSRVGDSYFFTFVQSDGGKELLTGCRKFNVSVTYERVPWFSWLPVVHSAHPTKQKTEEAAHYLRSSSQSGQEIYFGYMGYGLVLKDTPCSFKSRGLENVQHDGKQLVLSYHELT